MSFRVAFGAALPFLVALTVAGCCSTDPAGLTDRDPDVRRNRLACMGEAAIDGGDEAALVSLTVAGALRLSDPAVEEHAAVRATGQRVVDGLHAPDVVAGVGARLAGPAQDPNQWVRSAAVSALGSLGGPVAASALRSAVLTDPSQDVRLAAARELGELEDRSGETTEALLDALRDESSGVRLNARRALRRIHAADLGLDPDTWRSWLEARGWQPTPAVTPDVPGTPAGPGPGEEWQPEPEPVPLPEGGDGAPTAEEPDARGSGEAPSVDEVPDPAPTPPDAPR